MNCFITDSVLRQSIMSGTPQIVYCCDTAKLKHGTTRNVCESFRTPRPSDHLADVAMTTTVLSAWLSDDDVVFYHEIVKRHTALSNDCF
jgi:hypothetical protein